MSKKYSSDRPLISSHSGFQPLKEAWLGDVFPEEFGHVIDHKNRDLFYIVAEKTKKDLDNLQKVMQGLGITVRRPNFDSVEDYLDDHGNLIKPPICPRDWAMVLGERLYITPQYRNSKTGFESTVNLYRDNNQQVQVCDRSVFDPINYLVFPSVVRVGKDLVIDVPQYREDHIFQPLFQDLAQTYRVHVTKTGDHADGVFCPIKAGWIFSTHYRKSYRTTFPQWEIYHLPNTTIARSNGYNGKWWLPDMDYAHYNQSVFDIARTWIGNAGETVFEVNMLVVDEKNVICIVEDDAACRQMELLGITPHVVNISTRGFWDGGIHCLTLDIYREGEMIDYWPDRGSLGVYYH